MPKNVNYFFYINRRQKVWEGADPKVRLILTVKAQFFKDRLTWNLLGNPEFMMKLQVCDFNQTGLTYFRVV